ncbi:MAG: sortase [Oscillospiraceae bacterium]|nr:sortase [Oscillospiraceae bacterium]
MRRRVWGIILVILGIAMLITGGTMYSRHLDKVASAERNTATLMDGLKRELELRHGKGSLPNVDKDEEGEIIYPEMDTADYYGLAMIGIIRVPSCGVELPVLSDWSYNKLEYAPCRYSGNIYAGDLVLMGHNYTCHFKPLKKVALGAEVEFEDVNGIVWKYRVDAIDSIHRSDVDALPSEHELILFTCEEYGVYRFVARCSLVETIEPEIIAEE